MTDLAPALTGTPSFVISPDDDRRDYHRLRRRVFVDEQALFTGDDRDEADDDPRTVVLVARDSGGTVLGGVRLGPAGPGPDIGWWNGGRLVVDPAVRGTRGIGPALIRAACAHAESAGALRFDATVQHRWEAMFGRLGWQRVRRTVVAGRPHTRMRWPIRRLHDLAAAAKSPLGDLVHGLAPAGWAGDDGAPVPGSDLIAACDAILPSMVERDPEWAGWCAVLVNVNDLAAMGAAPVGLLNAVAGRDAAFVARVLTGLRRAAQAYGVPVLGGHTQLGVPAALSATALGRAAHPVPGGGGRPGHRIRLTADLGGRWRPGYQGRQWDSTSRRSPAELQEMTGFVGAARPAAAKDVSMAGIAGTLGMLAEASGCGAILDVAAVPRPAAATAGDWLTCFPGFAMLTAGELRAAPSGPAVTAGCGELVAGQGVQLRWPDGELTPAIGGGVTGLGTATS
ncbi:MSMEG_0567/sll0787 family protein [Paractinoplanes atraurantiacus]|uniref:Putative N-acetyltransferase, MSMEG_0567 N-terminal domain family n=1 Tax=Paractinoplanes atraurantiacus TaxID=1036182 RepID=A0A285K258_9ACTN|nr:MSMEG_0567/sll0787 family protein [Actinoplanes atraurantiacus]SNY66097.1 putative N-acetyltransferase, MSMEG_0567 N-terminal domain family [Actinoplanes atraurantiacus]